MNEKKIDKNEKKIDTILQNISYDEIISDTEIYFIEEELEFTKEMSQMKDNILKSVKNNRLHHRRIINALAVSTFLLIVFIGVTPLGSKTLAHIVDKLYFIPGLGKAEVNIEDKIYILKEQYQYDKDHKEMIITAITQYQNTMVIHMSGNYNRWSKLVIESEGTRYESSSSSTGYGEGFVGSYYFEISEPMTSFNLLLSEEDVIPITLVEGESYQEYVAMGPTDVINDFGITLVPRRVDNIIYFDLVQHKNNQGMVAYYGTLVDKEFKQDIKIQIKDNAEDNYPVEYRSPYAGVLSSFFFTPSMEQMEYTIQIPDITLKYEVNKELILPMPKEGENIINQRVEMGDFAITITKIVRENDNVTVYMDTDSSNQWEKLSYIMLDMKEMSLDYLQRNLNNNITIESVEFPINPKKKNLKIVIQELFTVLEGPWNFQVDTTSFAK